MACFLSFFFLLWFLRMKSTIADDYLCVLLLVLGSFHRSLFFLFFFFLRMIYLHRSLWRRNENLIFSCFRLQRYIFLCVFLFFLLCLHNFQLFFFVFFWFLLLFSHFTRLIVKTLSTLKRHLNEFGNLWVHPSKRTEIDIGSLEQSLCLSMLCCKKTSSRN